MPISALYASDGIFDGKNIQFIKDFFAKFKDKKASTPVEVKRAQLPPISYSQYAGLTYESLHQGYNEEITPIIDEILFSDFSKLPEEYDIWDNNKLNPYNVSLVGMKDTIKIDVSKYYPPSKKHITSDWGFRKWKYHYGIDLKVHKGDTVRSAFDGVVL